MAQGDRPGDAAGTTSDDVRDVQATHDNAMEDEPRVTTAEMMRVGVSDQAPYGRPGRPMDRRSPLYIGFYGAIGVLFAYLLWQAVARVSGVLLLVLIAAFLAVGLDPAVRALVKRGMRRGIAVLLVTLTLLGGITVFFVAVVPPVVTQTQTFIEEAPDYVAELREGDGAFARQLREWNLVTRLEEFTESDRLAEVGVRALGGAFGVGRVLLGVVFSTVTIVVLTLYFLANMPGIKRTAYRLVPASRRPRAQLIAEDVLARIGGFVLGNLLTSLIAGVFSFIVFKAIGVPYPLALAVLYAVLSLVPLVGGTVASIVAVLVAALVSLQTAIITLVVTTIYQQVENYYIVPRVMKKTVDVPAAAIIVSALLGGALLGIVGALIAVPAAAAIQLIFREVLLPRQEAH